MINTSIGNAESKTKGHLVCRSPEEDKDKKDEDEEEKDHNIKDK